MIGGRGEFARVPTCVDAEGHVDALEVVLATLPGLALQVPAGAWFTPKHTIMRMMAATASSSAEQKRVGEPGRERGTQR